MRANIVLLKDSSCLCCCRSWYGKVEQLTFFWEFRARVYIKGSCLSRLEVCYGTAVTKCIVTVGSLHSLHMLYIIISHFIFCSLIRGIKCRYSRVLFPHFSLHLCTCHRGTWALTKVFLFCSARCKWSQVYLHFLMFIVVFSTPYCLCFMSCTFIFVFIFSVHLKFTFIFVFIISALCFVKVFLRNLQLFHWKEYF